MVNTKQAFAIISYIIVNRDLRVNEITRREKRKYREKNIIRETPEEFQPKVGTNYRNNNV